MSSTLCTPAAAGSLGAHVEVMANLCRNIAAAKRRWACYPARIWEQKVSIDINNVIIDVIVVVGLVH